MLNICSSSVLSLLILLWRSVFPHLLQWGLWLEAAELCRTCSSSRLQTNFHCMTHGARGEGHTLTPPVQLCFREDWRTWRQFLLPQFYRINLTGMPSFYITRFLEDSGLKLLKFTLRNMPRHGSVFPQFHSSSAALTSHKNLEDIMSADSKRQVTTQQTK